MGSASSARASKHTEDNTLDRGIKHNAKRKQKNEAEATATEQHHPSLTADTQDCRDRPLPENCKEDRVRAPEKEPPGTVSPSTENLVSCLKGHIRNKEEDLAVDTIELDKAADEYIENVSFSDPCHTMQNRTPYHDSFRPSQHSIIKAEELLDRLPADTENSLFLDKDFLPSDVSIGGDMCAQIATATGSNITWKHASLFKNFKPKHMRRASKQMPTKLWQGQIENCYLIAPLNAIMQQVQRKKYEQVCRIITTRASAKIGASIVFLYIFMAWKPVLVDWYLPIFEGSKSLVFAHTKSKSHEGLCAALLIEKALAKISGSYQALETSWSTVDALTMLTSAPAQHVRFDERNEENVWHLLTNLEEEYHTLTTSSKAIKTKEMKSLHIKRNHTYAITSLDIATRTIALSCPSSRRNANMNLSYAQYWACFDGIDIAMPTAGLKRIRSPSFVNIPCRSSQRQPSLIFEMRLTYSHVPTSNEWVVVGLHRKVNKHLCHFEVFIGDNFSSKLVYVASSGISELTDTYKRIMLPIDIPKPAILWVVPYLLVESKLEPILAIEQQAVACSLCAPALKLDGVVKSVKPIPNGIKSAINAAYTCEATVHGSRYMPILLDGSSTLPTKNSVHAQLFKWQNENGIIVLGLDLGDNKPKIRQTAHVTLILDLEEMDVLYSESTEIAGTQPSSSSPLVKLCASHTEGGRSKGLGSFVILARNSAGPYSLDVKIVQASFVNNVL